MATLVTTAPFDSEGIALWGVKSIARFIGTTDRAAYHLLEKGNLPGRKVGGSWVASKDQLRAYLRGEEG